MKKKESALNLRSAAKKLTFLAAIPLVIYLLFPLIAQTQNEQLFNETKEEEPQFLIGDNADNLVPTFLSTGKVSLNLSANDNDYAEAVVIQPDGKVVVGGTDNDFRIARYDANGTLDPAFGINGVATVHFGAQDSLYDIALQADGKIVAVGAGNVNAPPDRYFAIARFNTDGTLDTSFDGDGKLTYNAFGGNDYATAVAIQSDQKIVVAGLYEPSSIDTAIIRLNTNGTFDNSFDGDGVRIYSLSSGQDFAKNLVIQPDQKILVGGIWDSPANHDFCVTRLNTNGSFDTTFDGDGYVATAVNGDDVLQGLALQSDGKIIGSGYSSGNQNFTVIRYTANGSLDTTFDGDGIVQTDFGLNRDDVGRNMAIQADGKILVVGETNTVNGSRYDYGIVRYNTDGSLDTTFDGDGKLLAQFNSNNSIPTDIVVQPGNKFIVVGRSNWQTVDFGAMRFNSNGTLDTTWGAGKINLDFAATNEEGRAVARQADGKLIVVGRHLNGSNFVASVARYNTDGTLDTTFGTGGKVTTQLNSTYPQAVALQTDGKIVVAGFTFASGNYDFMVWRYNPNGTLDTSFDSDGIATLNVACCDQLYGVAIQPDGKIVAVGTLYNGSTDEYVVLRYNTNGSLDTSFDGDGRATTGLLNNDQAHAVAIQPDGKIIAAGYSSPSSSDFSIARYNTNGSIDTTFNSVGYVIASIGTGDDVVQAITLQPDGKIVVAGKANGGASADDFALARFNPNGTFDTGFDIDGKVTTSFSNSNDQAFGVAVQPNGKILTSGFANNGHTNDFAFARYNANGSPDNTFNGNGRRFLDFSGYNDGDVNITGNNLLLQPDGTAVTVSTTNNGINTDIGIAQLNILNSSIPFDFDGDNKTDIGIFRPTPGEWWINRSSNGSTFATQFGNSADKLAPVDFTGDGKTDVAIFRPSSGQWFVLRSEDNSFFAFPFGTSGDVPVPADYDGDAKADAAVFRPSNLTWFINKSTGGTDIIGFGAAGDKPVVADYDSDGKADIAIYRANGGVSEWWIRQSSNSTVIAFQFGAATDKAVQGDYTGDGKSDIAVWRPSNGNWFILRSEDFSFFAFPFGTTGDVPVPGDYDGDGKFDAGVFRPSNSTWFIQRSTAGTLIQGFGIAGDIPTPSAFLP